MEANNQEQDQDLDVVKVTPEESIDENTEVFKKEVSLRFYIIVLSISNWVMSVM